MMVQQHPKPVGAAALRRTNVPAKVDSNGDSGTLLLELRTSLHTAGKDEFPTTWIVRVPGPLRAA